MKHTFQKWNKAEVGAVLITYGSLHAREIGRRCGLSAATLSRVLNSLIKDNILDVRADGRNKYYSFKSNLNAKNFIYLVEHYKLNKLLVSYPKLQVLFSDILNTTSSLVIVFGSYAKYCPRESSDIDVYVKSKSRDVKNKIETLDEQINVKIGDLSKGNPLANEIRKHHVILRGVEEFYGKT